MADCSVIYLMVTVFFLLTVSGIYLILSEGEETREIAGRHLSWHLATVEWEREKLRTSAISSPRTRLSYRRRRNAMMKG